MITTLKRGRGLFNTYYRRGLSTKNPYIIYSDSVRHALENNQPVVALESTIVTHGMPYPENVSCAIECEKQVERAGAIPATIAILKGRLTIGLTHGEIEHIAQLKDGDVVKTSRRDFAHVIGSRLYGGTTVSGTLLAAHMAGIKVMATGGIGGVHRSGEKTLDISADLQEMGRTPIAVVSSGVKSILDIPRTLEYLETQGVYVATFGATKDFPAFYTRESGCKSPYNVTSAIQAAQVIKAAADLGLHSGMLFAVPVPEEFAMDSTLMEQVIQEALKRAEAQGVKGKEITPFLLGHVVRATEGKSLQTNMCLVQNNAKVGGRIAVELCKLQTGSDHQNGQGVQPQNPIVVIGGSVLDRCVTVLDDEIKMDGRIHDGKMTESAGGVARNICDALTKLQREDIHVPVFITAIGDDESGKTIASSLHGQQQQPINFRSARTAQCLVVFDSKGECRFLVGDMDVHSQLTPAIIRQCERQIREAPLVVIDGNLSAESMEETCRIAMKHHVPGLWQVCFENFTDFRHFYDYRFTGCWWVFEEEYYIIHDWLLPGFFLATQFFFTLCMTLLLVAAFLTWLYCFCSRDHDKYILLLLTVGTDLIISGCCGLIAVLIFGSNGDNRYWMPNWEHNDLSWSFGFAVVGTLLLLPAGALFLVEARRARYRRLQASRPSSHYDMEIRKSSHTEI